MANPKRALTLSERKLIVNHCSFWSDKEASFARLIEQGDVNFIAADPAGSHTPLGFALLYGHWSAARALLRHGANPFLKDPDNPFAPFRMAISGLQELGVTNGSSSEALEVFKMLSEAGVALEILPDPPTDAYGHSCCAYDRALNHGNPRQDSSGGFIAFDALISVGLDISSFNGADLTPLMLAARWGKADFTRYLLSKGADQSLVSDEGDTALSLALQSERFEAALALLESAPQSVLDHRAYPGRGPMAMACACSRQGAIACDDRRQVIERLAELGQSFLERDRMSRSPIDLLRDNSDPSFHRLAEWAELFEIAKAPPRERKPLRAL